MKMFGNGIPRGLKYEFIELGTNKKTNVENATFCLKRMVEYQARLTFAAELLTEWGEPTAAEPFRTEVKIAGGIVHDVFRKMCATMTAKGMSSAQIEAYCKEQFGVSVPWGPSDSMIYERFKKGDTARIIADRTLDAWET
jgi:hypothetical protein